MVIAGYEAPLGKGEAREEWVKGELREREREIPATLQDHPLLSYAKGIVSSDDKLWGHKVANTAINNRYMGNIEFELIDRSIFWVIRF
jgi:hypothetical protein